VSRDTLADVRAAAARDHAANVFRGFVVKMTCLPPAEKLTGVLKVTLQGTCDLAGETADIETTVVVLLDGNVSRLSPGTADALGRWRNSLQARTTATKKGTFNRLFELGPEGAIASQELVGKVDKRTPDPPVAKKGRAHAVDTTRAFDAVVGHLQRIVQDLSLQLDAEASDAMTAIHLVFVLSSHASLPSTSATAWATFKQLIGEDLARVNATLHLHILCGSDVLVDRSCEQFGELEWGQHVPVVIHVDMTSTEAFEASLRATADAASGQFVSLKVRLEAPKQQGRFTHTIIVDAVALVRACGWVVVRACRHGGARPGGGWVNSVGTGVWARTDRYHLQISQCQECELNCATGSMADSVCPGRWWWAFTTGFFVLSQAIG
jgi:hypothetical protein